MSVPAATRRVCRRCGAPISRRAPVCPYCRTLDDSAVVDRVEAAAAVVRADHAADLARRELALAEALSHSWQAHVDAFLIPGVALLWGAISFWLAPRLGAGNALRVFAPGFFAAILSGIVAERIAAPSRRLRKRAALVLAARRGRCQSCGAEYALTPERDGIGRCPFCQSDAELFSVRELDAEAKRAQIAAGQAQTQRQVAEWESGMRSTWAFGLPGWLVALAGVALLFLAAGRASTAWAAARPLWSPYSPAACALDASCVPLAAVPRDGPAGEPLRLVRRDAGDLALLVFSGELPRACDSALRLALGDGADEWSFSAFWPSQRDLAPERCGLDQHCGRWISPDRPELRGAFLGGSAASPEAVSLFFRDAYRGQVRDQGQALVGSGLHPLVARVLEVGEPDHAWTVSLWACGENATLVTAR